MKSEAGIRAKVKELAALQKRADTMHIEVMREVGCLVNAVQEVRGYDSRLSAEDDVTLMLKGAGMYRAGIGYVRACWQYVFKLNDSQRRQIERFELGVEDIKALTTMDMGRIDNILDDIKENRLLPAYGKGGMTYHIRSILSPASKGRRRQFKQELGIHDPTTDPGVISGKVFRRGNLDESALEDLLANIYSRVDYATVEKCRQAALRRAGRAVA